MISKNTLNFIFAYDCVGLFNFPPNFDKCYSYIKFLQNTSCPKSKFLLFFQNLNIREDEQKIEEKFTF